MVGSVVVGPVDVRGSPWSSLRLVWRCTRLFAWASCAVWESPDVSPFEGTSAQVAEHEVEAEEVPRPVGETKQIALLLGRLDGETVARVARE